MLPTGEPTFINLDMEEYHDLDLTVAVFTRILESFPDLEAGIVLQAYLPDALSAMQELQEWAAKRRSNGGAPIKVRVVKGANLAMERVDAAIHGWPLATWSTKQETDTNYKRVLDWAMTTERVDGVRIGVAGQNLFDIAYAWLLAGDRGVRDAVEFEMLLGMDTGPTDAVRADIDQLLLYTPVVKPAEFDVAISYLVRRLEENASSDNFMSAAFEIADNPELLSREIQRFLDSVKDLDETVPQPHRNQNRMTEAPRAGIEHVHQHPRHRLRRRAPTASGAGSCSAARSTPSSVPRPYGPTRSPVPRASRRSSRRLARRGSAWHARGSEVRAWILHEAASALGARRGDLISVMAAEAGKTIAEGDVEVSEAIDFANYYAESARRLDVVDGAEFVPDRLTVVTPPWNFPVAIPAGSVLAALAVGSGVIIKAAPQTPRSAAVMVEALWQAGVPRDVLRFVTIDEGPLSKALISHSDVDRVILTGCVGDRRPVPVVAPRAAAAGRDERQERHHRDAERRPRPRGRRRRQERLRPCRTEVLGREPGDRGRLGRPLRAIPTPARRRRVIAASRVPHRPRSHDGSDHRATARQARRGTHHARSTARAGCSHPTSWAATLACGRPASATAYVPGSTFHRTEYFGPILGVMHAKSLAQAIEWQNATDYGLTAGIHSLDADEVNTWIDEVQAGNLYVNRGTTGAIVQRQPFGGWKRSSVGTTAKAGGPNYLTHLGSWKSRPLRDAAPVKVLPEVEAILEAAKSELTPAELA